MKNLCFKSTFAVVLILHFGFPKTIYSAHWQCLLQLKGIVHRTHNFYHHLSNPNSISYKNLKNRLKSLSQQRKFIGLKQLKHLHPIDYPIKKTWNKIEKRKENLERYREEIRAQGNQISIELQMELIPSTSPMLVIRDRDGRYAVVDGNGRLYALRNVFLGDENPYLEVMVVEHNDPNLFSIIKSIRESKNLND